MNKLTGKIAVITGGTQGLGAAIARLFADRGASGIVTCGRSVAKGQAKAREIQDATGTKVVFAAADLGEIEIVGPSSRRLTPNSAASTCW